MSDGNPKIIERQLAKCVRLPTRKILDRLPEIISIYIKEQRFFPLLEHNVRTTGHIWTNDTILEPAWHVDGLSWSKISLPTTMEWPGTQTCPKLSRSAIISETMRQIEILRALYFIQLLILVSGGWNPPDARTHFNAFRRTIWSPERFCQFCLV